MPSSKEKHIIQGGGSLVYIYSDGTGIEGTA